MTEKADDARPDPQTRSFEQALEELEEIILRIEDGEIGLEESLGERRRGEALIRRCRAILDAAEKDLEKAIVDDEDGDSASPPS